MLFHIFIFFFNALISDFIQCYFYNKLQLSEKKKFLSQKILMLGFEFGKQTVYCKISIKSLAAYTPNLSY